MGEGLKNRRRRDRKSRRRKGDGRGRWAFLCILILAVAGCCVFGAIKLAEIRSSKEPREEAKQVVAESLADILDGSQNRGKADVEDLLKSMTLDEKILQLFIITPEALTGVDEVYAAGETTKKAYEEYPVGGLVYFNQNLRSYGQTLDMLTKMKQYGLKRTGTVPFLSVDEEGGSVARISGREGYDIPALPDMEKIGRSGDAKKAYEVGKTIGGYLSDLGFNLDYAPVADVLTNQENSVVAKRSFGTDRNTVAEFSVAAAKGLEEMGVSACLKHFPGHGGTKGDTHDGYAYTDKTLEQLMADELVPFKKGIEAGTDFIMVAHIAAPNVTGDKVPSSMSQTMVTEVLRKQLGYDGIVITDALNMGAVASSYSSGDAAVLALDAGVDILLMPKDFKEAYEAVKSAVASGKISEARIDESVRRILKVKVKKK